MKKAFLVAVICALLFDLWFSSGLPWVTITIVVLAVVYKIATPFLRI